MYIGGGTPTVIGDKLIAIINAASKSFKIREISVETNPDFLDTHNLLLLRDAGVNRLSVGVQSFDDGILKSIGRLEKYGGAAEISEKISRAKGIFNTLNIDLIFNFPHQSMNSLDKDLDHIDQLLPDQVTFYPLMRSDYTRDSMTHAFGRVDFKKERAFYFKILERIKRNYTHSTAWCFSRNSSMIDEYVVHYDNYIGAGSGAFGYTSGKIFVNTFSIENYISLINNSMLPTWGTKKFSKRQTVYYYILMKLFGMSLNKDDFEDRFKKSVWKKLFPEMLLLKTIKAVKENNSELRLTEKGSYLWVIAMREFFKAVDNLRDQCRNALK